MKYAKEIREKQSKHWGYYNPYQYQIKGGKKFPWTLSLVYPN